MKQIIVCEYCGNGTEKESGEINRAKKKGAPLYCDRTCAGNGRRKPKTDGQKKEEKRVYDMKYREENKETLKKKKAAWFQGWYDPEKAKIKRKEGMARHIEYCRQPEYRKWKKQYDQTYKAKKNYGEYFESAILTLKIREECLERETDYQIRFNNQTLNKAQRRKRDVKKTQCS